ncbi:MAG: nitronate monooxygenase [Chloroflexi bacterium]|nr:nitronate monooxygenase [Chloroflexota bacterium]MBM3172671.1 nitronate monooxygenase [Chloroflexota bacterium]MBM3174290.1 nitronate monooxygenase [Chloroflexota bacterium]MBM4451082.1 nitronate monooxygenase [Chloroflexota bacterium]
MTNKKTLRTELCDMLGIEYPILLAGMGGIAGEGHAAQPKLAAAVSNAGGMGVLGATGLPLDELRSEIREIKRMTDKPFGVDVLLPEGIGEAPPPDISMAELKKQFVPQPHMDFVEKIAAEYGVALKEAKTDLVLSVEHSKKQIQVMLEEKVPLYCAGLGIPDWLVPMAHEGGMKVLGLAGNVRGALRHKKAGADFIVAQGHEAGGHTGRIGTLALVPQVMDAVKPTPVLAAGGIGDGRGLAAALALGAVGVWVGTAFLFAEEANVIEVHRKALITANEEDTRVSRVWSGKTLRQMKNPIQEAFDNSGLKPLSVIIQVLLMLDLIDSLSKAKRHDLLCSPVGQIVGMLKDVRPAKDILNDMVGEAVDILDKKLPARVKAKP